MEVGGGGDTAEKAMLIIMRAARERRGKEVSARPARDSSVHARPGRAREKERGGERAQSRSDAIVVPQHFLPTATVFVCLVSMVTANT